MQVWVNQSSGIWELGSAVLFVRFALKFRSQILSSVCFFRGQLRWIVEPVAVEESLLFYAVLCSFMQFAYVLPASVGLFSYIIVYYLQNVPVKPNRPSFVANLQDADEWVGGRPERWRVHSVHHLGVSRIVKGLFLIWPVDCKILV